MVADDSTVEEQAIPDFLVREIIGGQKFYYKGYKAVVSKAKTFESIAYSSSLQAILSTYLTMQIVKGNLHKRYTILSGNPGLAVDANNHLVCAGLLYEPAIFPIEKASAKYVDAAPALALLMDDRVEVDSHYHPLYIRKKMEALLGFGVAKVIWVFTFSRQVMIAAPNCPWLTYDWNETIELLDGASFNVGEYLDRKGVKLPE